MLEFQVPLVLRLAAPGSTLVQERFRLGTPLGLDECFSVHDDNSITPGREAVKNYRCYFQSNLAVLRKDATPIGSWYMYYNAEKSLAAILVFFAGLGAGSVAAQQGNAPPTRPATHVPQTPVWRARRQPFTCRG